MRRTIAPAALLVAAVLVASCHSDSSSSPTAASPTTYEGTFTGSGNTSGKISMTLTPPAAAPGILPLGTALDDVSGTITVMGGAAAAITGTFMPPIGPLNVTGGGFTLTGNLSGNILNGTWNGPGGNGWFSTLPSSPDTVNVYCGNFIETSGGGDSGIWNLVQAGTALTGTFTSVNGNTGVLYGAIVNGVMTMHFGTDGTADGTIDLNAVSGTWTAGSASGTWSGSLAACTGSAAR